jgi:uncharacterized protein (TIGR03435 family)
MFTPDGFKASNVPLQTLVKEAYKVEDDRISGAPNWARSDKYDIEAKVEGTEEADVEKLSFDQRQLMLRPFLADHFKLKFHRATKDLPVYELVNTEGGPKLHKSKSDEPGPNRLKGPHVFRYTESGQLIAQGLSMSLLVRLLSEQVGHTVVNKTGLAGSYEFTLQWKPDESMVSQTPMFSERQGDAGTASGPSIFTAVQEQLGLKLVPQKEAMEVLVIDHVETPAEN